MVPQHVTRATLTNDSATHRTSFCILALIFRCRRSVLARYRYLRIIRLSQLPSLFLIKPWALTTWTSVVPWDIGTGQTIGSVCQHQILWALGCFCSDYHSTLGASIIPTLRKSWKIEGNISSDDWAMYVIGIIFHRLWFDRWIFWYSNVSWFVCTASCCTVGLSIQFIPWEPL
jgi:hypothetical protein